MPGPTFLTSRFTTNLILSWRTNYVGYAMQTSLNLMNWANMTNALSSSGGQYFLTNTISLRTRFFRLAKPLPPPNDQLFFSTNKGTITITGYFGLGGEVIIPPMINGLPVTAIADSAFSFSYNSSITGISLPDTLVSIGSDAFNGCTFPSITIPASVTNIADQAFFGSFCEITVDPSDAFFSSLDGVLFNKHQTTLLHYPGFKAGSYTVPSTVTAISDGGFEGALTLTGVTIPDSVVSFGAGAFEDCYSLTNIVVGPNVTNIGALAFDVPPQLQGIYFEGNAPSVPCGTFAGGNGLTLYYLPGTSGWATNVACVRTALWTLPYPVILNTANSVSIGSNGFGFTISWATNHALIVQACTNLLRPIWQTVQTNILSNGVSYFTDPTWTNFPARLYRVGIP